MDQNEWVYDNMLDYYLFYDQVPVVEPGDFESPRALLRELRFEEAAGDPFSFIAPATESDLEFEEGREFGLGYVWGEEFDGSARIVSVVLDSPFGRAGIERGDVIVEINGSPALEVLNDRARFGAEVFGTREAPVESTWTFAERDGGEPFTARFTAAEYRISTPCATPTCSPPPPTTARSATSCSSASSGRRRRSSRRCSRRSARRA